MLSISRDRGEGGRKKATYENTPVEGVITGDKLVDLKKSVSLDLQANV